MIRIMASIIRVKYVASVREKYADIDATQNILLVNINCPLKLILKYIKSTVGLNETDEFDLCDEDHCRLKNVSLYEPHASGLSIFQAGLTYLIVMYEQDTDGKIVNFLPLLSGKDAKKCTDIILKTQITNKTAPSVKSTVKKNNNKNKIPHN